MQRGRNVLHLILLFDLIPRICFQRQERSIWGHSLRRWRPSSHSSHGPNKWHWDVSLALISGASEYFAEFLQGLSVLIDHFWNIYDLIKVNNCFSWKAKNERPRCSYNQRESLAGTHPSFLLTSWASITSLQHKIGEIIQMQISVQETCSPVPRNRKEVKRRCSELRLRNQRTALEELIKIQELNVFRYTVSLNYAKCVWLSHV